MQDGISLPHLPREVVVRIFERLPILSFLGGAVATCRKFSLKWYLERSFQKVVVVPDEEKSINAAMNRLAKEGDVGQGLVLVRPGLYSETVRVTQNCYVLGFGPSHVARSPRSTRLAFLFLGSPHHNRIVYKKVRTHY